MDASPNADTLTAALDYMRRGFSIFPLVPRTKQPAVKIEPLLSGEQRMTEDEARAYWTAHPDAGVAIVMGAPSGLICLDVDPRHGGQPAETARDCPTGLVAQTGRGDGGLHLFVRHPGSHVPKGKTSRPGVDRQGDRSYVVAAPTLHEDTGKPYCWLNEGDPGELPAWALERPTAAAGDGDDEAREPWIAAALKGVGEGQRNGTCARLAGYFFKRRLPLDVTEHALAAWNMKNTPPMDVAEVITTVRSVYETAQRGGQSGAGTAVDWEARIDAAMRTAAAMATTEAERVEWAVQPWIAFGALTELDGEVKEAGKTTFVSWCVRVILDGADFMGEPTTKTRVVWLTEQPWSSFQEVLRRAGILHREELTVLRFHDVIGAPWPVVVERAIKRAQDDGARVLIVDTLPQFAGLQGDDENNAGAALNALEPVQRAIASGMAVILVRRTRKAGGSLSTAGRRSNAFSGAVDVILNLSKPEHQPNTVRRLRAIGRFDSPDDTLIELTEDGYVKLGSTNAAARQHTSDTVLAALPTDAGAAITKKDIEAKTSLSETTVRRALDELVRFHLAEKVGDGRGQGASPTRYWRLPCPPDPLDERASVVSSSPGIRCDDGRCAVTSSGGCEDVSSSPQVPELPSSRQNPGEGVTTEGAAPGRTKERRPARRRSRTGQRGRRASSGARR